VPSFTSKDDRIGEGSHNGLKSELKFGLESGLKSGLNT
jgi:hypothetical protein